MIAHHFVCRAVPGQKLFRTREEARDLWSRMRSAFPEAIASAEMPTHLHLLDPERGPALKHRMSCILSAWRRKHGIPALEMPLPDPTPIPDAKHLLRQIRYVHLNPCRDRLARDPVEWEWSTHRDWLGAIADPWPMIDQWSKALGYRRNETPGHLHAYISGDPTVNVAGTPPPRLPNPVPKTDTFGPRRIVSALPLVLRASEVPGRFNRAQRSLAARALRELTSASYSEIGEFLGISKSAAARLASGPELPARAKNALILTLDDERLFSPARSWEGLGTSSKRIVPFSA